MVQAGAGINSGYADTDYEQAGAFVEPSVEKLVAEADGVVKVQPPSLDEIELLKQGSIYISVVQSLHRHDIANKLAERQITAFGLDAIPRITLAQSMDVLSSMSTIAGYKAVLLAADNINKFFPMLMTAAGTVAPARVMRGMASSPKAVIWRSASHCQATWRCSRGDRCQTGGQGAGAERRRQVS